MKNRDRTLILHHLVNISAAIIWGFFTYRSFRQVAKFPALSLEAISYLA